MLFFILLALTALIMGFWILIITRESWALAWTVCSLMVTAVLVAAFAYDSRSGLAIELLKIIISGLAFLGLLLPLWAWSDKAKS